MTRRFIMTSGFDAQWKSMGLSDDDLRRLQIMILENTQVGDVVQGTGGLRKIRFALSGRGKSGGARVVYVDFVMAETVVLINAYPKNKKSDLSENEKSSIKKMIAVLKQALEGGTSL